MSDAAKPIGPTPAGFETIDGELAIGGRKASDLAAAQNTMLRLFTRDDRAADERSPRSLA